MDTQKLHDLIDKVIGKSGPLRTPAWWMRRVLNAIMEAMTAAANEVRELLYALSDKTDNVVNSLSERIGELEDVVLLEKYLCLVALEDGFKTRFSTDCEYSLDGKNWHVLHASGVHFTPAINKGECIYFKRSGHTPREYYGSGRFLDLFYDYAVKGNIMSMLYGDEATRHSPMKEYAFNSLFADTDLKDASQLILPTTAMSKECYSRMFYNCSILEKPPQILATTLAPNCFAEMFYNCSSLTEAPKLPFLVLAKSCYSNMFRGCTCLIVAPDLPATSLHPFCYEKMFEGCTRLQKAPIISAETLAERCCFSMFRNCKSLLKAPTLYAKAFSQDSYYGDLCYRSMFEGCSRLSYIRAEFIDIPRDETYEWLKGVAPTGTFVKNAAATWDVVGTSGIPEGWAVETAEVVDNA